MKVLVIGSGGREHALVKKLAESKRTTTVYVLPGNGGTQRLRGKVCNVTSICQSNTEAVIEFAKREGIGLVVIGPEQPLVAGIWDKFNAHNIRCVGPSGAGSIVEASKAWSKDFMTRNNIPTARYHIFTDSDAALAHVRTVDYDVVIKASGLAAGKGVVLPSNVHEAEEAVLALMRDKSFGQAGEEVVIEERLTGEEVSLLAFTDGTAAVCMPPAQDHKRAHDHDEGLNTGGMGAYAPAPVLSAASLDLQRQCDDIVQRTITALASEGLLYQGILYTGLMLTSSGPKVLEYNCRFGDPETQVLLPLLESDLVDIFLACTDNTLEANMVQWKQHASACTVVCAAAGYPGVYHKGDVITGLDDVRTLQGVTVFHAGTRCVEGAPTGILADTPNACSGDVQDAPLCAPVQDIESDDRSGSSKRLRKSPAEEVVTTGGRVLAVTGVGATLHEAVRKAYEGVDRVSYQGIFYRRDIAYRALHAPVRIGILGSTRGTDMQAIIDAIEGGTLNAQLVVCISNKKSSGILERAARHGIPTVHIAVAGLSREDYDDKVSSALALHGVQLVLLIGYMRIVSGSFVQRWFWRCLNVHPSLLPEFSGGMDTDVHAAVLAAGRDTTGCTVHFVTEDVDAGPIVIQKSCPVDISHDTPATLKSKVQQLEGKALIEAIELFRVGLIGPACKGGVAGQSGSITYKSSGVDIDAGERLVDRIKPMCRGTRRTGCNADLGGFGGLFDLQHAGLSGTDDTVLVSGADGVGTKLLIAQAVGKHDTVGIDLVAMNVNDIIVSGAQPLFFLDYYATGHLDVDVAAQVVSGIAAGCLQAGAALIGGETAEMAGMYAPGEYDLAGFSVGAVKRSLLLPRSQDMSAGDLLIGLRSSGLHSNGFSLVRKCVQQLSGLTWTDMAPFAPSVQLGEALLCPTKIYVQTLQPLITKGLVKGMAHITGGGIIENTPRVLPEHLMALVDIEESNWELPAVFKWIRDTANIAQAELLRTLNCGVGMVIVIAPECEEVVRQELQDKGEGDILLLGRLGLRPHVEYPQVLVHGLFL